MHSAARVVTRAPPGRNCKTSTLRSGPALRPAPGVRRRRRPLRALQPGRALRFRRPVEEPLDAATQACCSTWRARCGVEVATRRHVRRRARSTSPKTARCCTSSALPRAPVQHQQQSTTIRREVHATLDAMLAYAEAAWARHRAITDVVNIGIGGSDLGPQMAVLALDAFAASGQALPLRLQRRRPRLAPRAAPAEAREHAVHHRLQDLHHAARR